MKQTFENYLKQARTDFAKVAGKYTVTEHLELRTAIDSLLIAYDQAVAKALILPVVVKSVKENTKKPLTNGNNEDSIKAFWKR